jgi:magnesium-protoporphyrin O-methyltransferase
MDRGQTLFHRMVSCHQCEGIKEQFGAETAAREIRRFRKRGAIRSTQLLIENLEASGVAGLTLLDVGGGIGAIHHALLERGVTTATHVDASPEYLAVARAEAERRSHAERVRFVQGDFVEIAGTIPAADIVTLDRVICCYPDMETLSARAGDHARRLVGLVIPRDVWWMRAAVKAVNAVKRLQRSAFRVFVHDPRRIDAALLAHDLTAERRTRTVAWDIVIYRRSNGREAR